MHQASVGFHCPSCVKGQAQRVVTARQLRSGGSGDTPVTIGLVALNAAIYVVSALGAGLSGPARDVLLDYALIGRGFASDRGLFGVAEGEWYRLVTGGFLHGSLLHIGFNMYILYVLGRQLEGSIGKGAFAAVYGTSLLAGSLGVMILEPDALTVGASGAVFGMFGYAVVGQLNRGINPMQTGLGGIVVINLLFTFLVPGISIGGHLGGLIGGFLAGLLYEGARSRLGLPRSIAVGAVLALGLVCVLGSVVVAGTL